MSTIDSDAQNGTEKTYVLPETVMFGFHKVCSNQIEIKENTFKAEKKDPSLHYAHGVAYGAKPLKGTAEFEVCITSYGTGWSGTLKLGILRCKAGSDLQTNSIPRYSPEGTDHCVWSSDKVHNRLSGSASVSVVEKSYGFVNLDDLREGDKVGMRLSHDGVLMFFVNGKSQGVAAENIYEKGHEVYPVVDHYANCKATVITRAVIRVELNLQVLCVELISTWLTSDQVEYLPLPRRLKNRIIQFINE